jgi:hypothetical protein
MASGVVPSWSGRACAQSYQTRIHASAWRCLLKGRSGAPPPRHKKGPLLPNFAHKRWSTFEIGSPLSINRMVLESQPPYKTVNSLFLLLRMALMLVQAAGCSEVCLPETPCSGSGHFDRMCRKLTECAAECVDCRQNGSTNASLRRVQIS